MKTEHDETKRIDGYDFFLVDGQIVWMDCIALHGTTSPISHVHPHPRTAYMGLSASTPFVVQNDAALKPPKLADSDSLLDPRTYIPTHLFSSARKTKNAEVEIFNFQGGGGDCLIRSEGTALR